MRNNNNNSNPTCQGIELEDLYNRLSSFYDDNYFEYYDNDAIHISLRKLSESLFETINLIESHIGNNNKVKLDNWIRNSSNQ